MATANDEYVSSQNQPSRSSPYETDDDLGGGGGFAGSPASQPRIPGAFSSGRPLPGSRNESAVGEVAGDAFIVTTRLGGESVSEVGMNEEVGTDGTESGAEFYEATPERLAAESGEETALSDLRGIEGFESPTGGESAALGAEPVLREAGSEGEGGQEEFFPILAALAPTLISTIGPMVAKAVVGRLSPHAQRVISRLPGAATGSKSLAGAAQGVLGAVKATSGNSNFLSLIAKLLAGAQAKTGTESGMEIDESFVTEAAAAIEVIIGTDDRIRIMETTQLPWRRICALRIQFPSGATYRGTGFLIGPRAVATAGHCVYLHNQGGWARKIEVIPGCNGMGRPFGQAESTSLRSVAGWVTGKKPESDYGCVVLPNGAFGGRNLGSFGFAAFDSAALLAQPAVVAGYPGDKPFAELWGMARRIKTVTAKTLVYDIDSMGGQSGAPVYIKRDGQRYAVGIHNYGEAAGNSATRVTPEVLERLRSWSKL